MSNLGTIPNNGAENYNSGLWPMPEPACASEADTTVKLSGIIKSAMGLSEQRGDSAPPAGGNDGDIDDKLIG